MKTTTPANARNPVQRRIIQDFLAKGEDPFDRKNIEQIYDEDETGKKTYNKVIAENSDWYAIPCLWPLSGSENHFIIIAQRNGVTSLEQLSEHEFQSFFEICTLLTKNYSLSGGAYCMRFGKPENSGTTVSHLHGHLVSPGQGESISFHIGNYNNPDKRKLSLSNEGDIVYGNHFWNAEVFGADRDQYLFKPLRARATKGDLPIGEQIKALFETIIITIDKENITGGGFCLYFGTSLQENASLIPYLVTTNETSTFEFIIKKQKP